MDDKTLKELREKVDAAETLKKKMEMLDDVVASCNAEVGFLSVTVNYRNQNEIRMVDTFPAKELFEAFKDDIKAAALKHKEQLEKQYTNLK
jgi:hypothetical protein